MAGTMSKLSWQPTCETLISFIINVPILSENEEILIIELAVHAFII
jgi:hypothetical protein